MSCSRGSSLSLSLLLVLLVAATVLPLPAEASLFFNSRLDSPVMKWWPHLGRAPPTTTTTTTNAPPASNQADSKAMMNAMPSFKSCPQGQMRAHDGRCRRVIFG